LSGFPLRVSSHLGIRPDWEPNAIQPGTESDPEVDVNAEEVAPDEES